MDGLDWILLRTLVQLEHLAVLKIVKSGSCLFRTLEQQITKDRLILCLVLYCTLYVQGDLIRDWKMITSFEGDLPAKNPSVNSQNMNGPS